MTSDREALVQIVALLDAADHKLHSLGHRQAMSIGPVIPQLNEVKEEVHQRGIDYGLLNKSSELMELRYEATEYDVVLQTDSDEETEPWG